MSLKRKIFRKNFQFHMVTGSLIFNVVSFLSISNVFLDVSVNMFFSTQETMTECLGILILSLFIFAPWFLGIKLSQNRACASGIILFSVVSVISCYFITGFDYSGPSEGVGYLIMIQIVSVWVTFLIFVPSKE